MGLGFTKNYVPIPVSIHERTGSAKKKVHESRIMHPLELGVSETGYKAQGATHVRDEVRASGMEHIPGLLYVLLSRTCSIKHIYIPESEWFNHFDIRLQRLNPDVLGAKCFEKMLRAKAAYDYRHYCQKKIMENVGRS